MAESLGDSAFVRAPARADALAAFACPSAPPLCAGGQLAEDGTQGAPSALQCPDAQSLCADGRLAEDGAQGAPSALARPGERIDDLQRDGLVILQRPGTFCFGTDSVLLADFAAPKKAERVADLGTGTGVLCLLMAASQREATFDAVELQPEMADMARRSVLMNHLEDRIFVHPLDMREAPAKLGFCTHTLVVCNPPYRAACALPEGVPDALRHARFLTSLSLYDVASSGARLLKNGGRMALVFPAERMLTLMQALVRANLAPKRVQLVHNKPGSVPKLVLLDAVKGGHAGL
ncbi:MAG: methyltransferase, partial [Clostridia bacterium]